MSRTTGAFLSLSQAFTYCYWLRDISEAPSGGIGRTHHALFTGNATDYSTPYFWEGSEVNTQDVEGYGIDDPAKGVGYTDYDTGDLPTVLNQWYHVAVIWDPSTKLITFYLDAVSKTITYTGLGAGNLRFASDTATAEALGGDVAGTAWSDTCIASYRSWQAALSQAEIQAERASPIARRRTNLFCETSLDSPTDLTDRTGNGRNWTITGTVGTTVRATPGPYTAPGFAFRDTSGFATGTTSLTITKPPATLDGDLLLMSLMHKGAGFATVPVGWTLIQQGLQGATRGELYWKRASGEPANYSVTGLATVARGVIDAYDGVVQQGSPVAVSGMNLVAAGGTTATPQVAATNIDGCLIYAMIASGANEAQSLLTSDTFLSNLAIEDKAVLNWPAREQAGGTGNWLGTYDSVKPVGTIQGASTGNTFSGERVAIVAMLMPETTVVRSTTKYYLTKRIPAVRLVGTAQGGWDSTSSSAEGYDTGDLFWQLSQQRVAGGHRQSRQGARNSDSPTPILVQRWVTPPLVAQTITGNLDLIAFTGVVNDDTSIGNPIPVGQIRLHVYISVGQTLVPRVTLLNQAVDPATFGSPTRWRETIIGWNSQTCQDGDTIVVEVGFLISVPTAYPKPIPYPPNQYAIWTFMVGSAGTVAASTNPDQSRLPLADATVGDAFNADRTPTLTFNPQLIEQTYSGTIPTNIDCGSAIVVSSLPYLNTQDLTHVPTSDRRVWYQYHAAIDQDLMIHCQGSTTRAGLILVSSCPATVPYLTGITQNVVDQDARAGLAVTTNVVHVTAGTTVWIATYTQAQSQVAPAAGGALRFGIQSLIPLANNDVIVQCSDLVARYTQAGVLADFRSNLGGQTAGLAIDYTQRPMNSLNGGIDTSIRLYVGLFSLNFALVLDLATLNKGQSEVDDITNVLTVDAGGHTGNFSLSSLSINPTGLLAIGWFGNGFRFVADGFTGTQSSYQVQIADPLTANLNTVDATHGDNQAGSPFPKAAIFTEALEVGGSNYIKFDPNNPNVVFYTSGGWYRPVGGTQVKRFDVVNNLQLPDFAGVPTGPGPNPGVKGIFPLPLTPTTPTGGCLVCNGGEVVQLDAGGNVVHHFVPSHPLAGRSVLYLVDVELQADGAAFWVLDGGTLTLYKFDMVTGNQIAAVETFLGDGNSTSIVIYRATPFPPAPPSGVPGCPNLFAPLPAGGPTCPTELPPG